MLRAATRVAATLSVIVVLVTGASAYGAKTNRTSQRSSAPRVGAKYISKRYGYEIVLQGTFVMIPAQVPWAGSFPYGSSGEVDIIIDRHDRKFIVAAKPVPSGMALSRWEAFIVGLHRQVCGRLRNFRASSLGGVSAREFVSSCPEYEVTSLAAIHKGHGYLLEYLSPEVAHFSAAAARRTYEAGRRSFKFTK